jgi:hypothetical protein
VAVFSILAWRQSIGYVTRKAVALEALRRAH